MGGGGRRREAGEERAGIGRNWKKNLQYFKMNGYSTCRRESLRKGVEDGGKRYGELK